MLKRTVPTSPKKESLRLMGDFVGRVIAYWPLALTFLLLLCLPVFFSAEENRNFISDFASASSRSLFIAIFLGVWSGKGKIARIVLLTLAAVLFFFEAYCSFQQGSRVNTSILFLVMQTDTAEAREYLSSFLLTFPTLKAIATTLIIIALGISLQYFWGKTGLVNRYRKMPVIVSIAVWCAIGLSIGDCLSPTRPHAHASELVGSLQFISMLGIPIIVFLACCAINNRSITTKIGNAIAILLVIISLSPAMIGKAVGKKYPLRANNTAQQIAESVENLLDEQIDFKKLEDSTSTAEAKACNHDDFKIVVVIGESFSKLHSSIYGYQLPTNPNLAKEIENGNLLAYSDCITRRPLTASVLQEVFSTWSLGDSMPWEAYPLFPAIFKKAGYTTALIDNHGTRTSDEYWQFKSSSFYSTNAMDSLCFDLRNDAIYDYDGDILEKYLPEYKGADLLLIHLKGQHIDAASRFPSDFKKFAPSDYDFRCEEWLTPAQIQKIADYDNATFYNDYVLKTIYDTYRNEDAIVVYFPDHGDEVYDIRDQYGRIIESPKPMLYPMLYEIPYFVWMSPKFMENRPDLALAFKYAANKPIVNSDIPHVILDLRGIKTPTFNPAKSYINEAFDSISPRILFDGTIYEK